ncbi:MAG: NAD(P)/FAD-dependent oxidoreductase [Desulfobacteraceae bacterium]|nr:NAD(P)/FAD-dependent oxidoreductase [Desulfobacteraceae bacterium]
MGIVSPDQLEKMAVVARKYKVETLKITTGQHLKMLGADQDDLPLIMEELGGSLPSGTPHAKVGLHNVQACSGSPLCSCAKGDTLNMGERLQKTFSGLVVPGKVKVAVSGCALNCCEGYVRDLGIFAKKSGWTLIFGGNAAGRPRIGDVIADKLSDDEVIRLAEKCLGYYCDNAKKGERSGHMVARLGLDSLLKAVK